MDIGSAWLFTPRRLVDEYVHVLIDMKDPHRNNEARLFGNRVRSYLSFLLTEYERLVREQQYR